MAFTNNTIYDYLPRFYQIEANNLKALQPGFVVAQVADIAAAATFTQDVNNIIGSSATTKSGLIANGHIVSLQDDGNGKIEITDAAATGVLYIVYNDPLVTVGSDLDYSLYATNTKGECLRLVQLIPGDEWMTDMPYDLTGNLQGRIAEVTTNSADQGWYDNKTLPDGTTAAHYIFLG